MLTSFERFAGRERFVSREIDRVEDFEVLERMGWKLEAINRLNPKEIKEISKTENFSETRVDIAYERARRKYKDLYPF